LETFFFSSAPVNSTIANAYDVGDGFVVGDTYFKGIAIAPGGMNLKFDPGFSLSSFQTTTFNETILLLPFNKTSFETVWNEGSFSGNDLTVVVSYNVIPEPAAMGLLGSGCSGLFLLRTLRRRKQAGQTVLPIRSERRCDLFCTETEWAERRMVDEEYEPTFLDALVNYAIEESMDAWNRTRAVVSDADKSFWNHMVARHERRLMRKQARRQAIKKKMIDSLDAFLAVIMK